MSQIDRQIQEATCRSVTLPGGNYKLAVCVDPYRGGYAAKLVAIGIGVVMEPNGATPKAAVAQLVRELRLFGDPDLAHQVVEATRGTRASRAHATKEIAARGKHPARRHHATRQAGADAWDVAMDAILQNDPNKAAQIVKQIRAEQGSTMTVTPEFSNAIAERASTDPVELSQIFDNLKPGQIIYIAMTAVMGGGRAGSGAYYPHKVGRRSKSKKPRWWSEAMGLEPVDGSKVPDFAKYKLWKRANGDISMSHGDMAVMLKGIYAP